MIRLFLACALFMATVASSALLRAQTPQDGWGFRLGMLNVAALPGARPLLQPYYEVKTANASPLTIVADLTLAFTDLGHLQIPSYDEHTMFDYGFHGGVREILMKKESWSLFGSALLGFDVFPDPPDLEPGYVCASFPISIGVLDHLSDRSQLELAATPRPVWYFRQAWGFSFAITAGLRFY